MAKFEGQERRMPKIEAALKEYGMTSLEEARDLCLSKGIDVESIVKGVQPIAFENAVWAYTLGDAIALKEGINKAAEAAEAFGIGLQAFAQRDPLVEYKLSGYEMFSAMTASIQEETVRILMHVRVEEKAEREQVAKVTGTNKDTSMANAPKKREAAKVYPNDPCPCGSGKKYKQCCGRKA